MATWHRKIFKGLPVPAYGAARRLMDDIRGNALIEFAFVVMILAVLGLGMFDFGRYALTYTRAYNAARAGAQFGTLNQSTAGNYPGMETAAFNDANIDPNNPGHFDPAADSFCMCPGSTTPEADCAGQCPGGGYKPRYVEVVVTDGLELLFDYPGMPDILPVSTVSRMRVR